MSNKVNTLIEVTYQANGSQSGLTDVTMVIYDETHSLDGTNFPDVTMTEIGSTGRYYGSFTPDAEGKWNIMIDSATKPGKVVRKFDVVGHDIDSVGDAVGALNDLSTSDVAGELATYDAPTKAELDTAESNIRGGSESLETIKTAIAALPQSAPPMIG